MKRIKFVFVFLIGVFLVASCVRNPYEEPKEEIFFDWKSITSVFLDIKVPVLSGAADDYYRTVNIYSSPLFLENSLVVSAAVSPDKPFEYSLDIPSAYKRVFIEIIEPNGTIKRFIQKVPDVKTEKIVIDLVPSSASFSTKSAVAMEINIPTWTVPATFDQTITSIPNSGLNIEGNKSYVIPAGTTLSSSKLNMSNSSYLNVHPELYVYGDLTITDNFTLQNASIVVMNGGSVTFTKDVSISPGGVSTKPDIYIMEGGSLSAPKITYGAQNVVVNKGELYISGTHNNNELHLSNSAKLYNSGKIYGQTNSTGDYLFSISITNASEIHNSGEIFAKNLKQTSMQGSPLYNYAGGVMAVKNFVMSNTQTYFFNEGSLICEDMQAQGTIDNYGYLGVISLEDNTEDVGLAGYALTVNMYEGSLMEVDELYLNASRVNMESNTIVSANSVTSLFRSQFTNTSTNPEDWALLIINESLCDLRWSGIENFDGQIEIFHKTLGSEGQELSHYETSSGPSYINNAFFTEGGLYENRVHNIPGNDYNKSLGVLTPTDPSLIDNDGDGVTADVDIDDNDATIAYRSYFPSLSSFGSLLYEDLWPNVGDYDMNDIVCDFQVVWTTNAANKVVSLDFLWKLRAVGSTLGLGMAVQLDGVAKGEVRTVTLSHIPTGTFPISFTNGMENNQSHAVIPLFNSPAELFGEDKLINTYLESTFLPLPETQNFRVTFNSPVEMSSVAIGKINPFIIVFDHGSTIRGKEIHLPTYPQTDLATREYNDYKSLSRTDPYRSSTGMMWGLMIPVSIGYPIETTNIENVYLHYKAWYESFGVNYPDWYENNEGYIDESKIYR